MKAIVLCAGYATRLYPLTLDKPKALLLINGKPVINYLIEKLERVEKIDEIIIVTNNRFYMGFVWWLNQSQRNFNKKIEILNDNTTSNETRLGGIGDLDLAIQEMKIDDDLLVLLGDNFFEVGLVDFVNFCLEKQEICLGISEVDDFEQAKKFGVIKLDSDNKIIDFQEKPEEPESTLVSTGIYFFPKEDVRLMKDYMKINENKDGPGYLIGHLYPKQEVFGFKLEGKWYDIGSIEQYKALK